MIKAIAYPNYDEITPMQPSYDLNKWTKAMRDVYVKTHLGTNRVDAISDITKSWDKVEARHFVDWMKFYESGDHLKYKKAQYKYYVNDDINFFVPNPQSNVPSPLKALNDNPLKVLEDANRPVVVPENKEEKREIIEDVRKKILGRLNSAEKILSTQQGHIFAGKDFERLLISIYELKKQIQTMNKISLSAQTCVDLIVRQANILRRSGFADASSFMVKLAQNTPGDFSMQLGEVPAGGSQPDGSGSLGNNNPSNLTQPLPIKDAPVGGDKAISEFMENLEGSGFTDFDKSDVSDSDDKKENKDEVVIDDDVFLDQDISPNDDSLVVEAQALPESDQGISKTEVVKPTLKSDLKKNIKALDQKDPAIIEPTKSKGLSVDSLKPTDNKPNDIGDHVDSLIDNAFGDITVPDIIAKLEQVLDIFRNREITKQLVICDLMLNRLNLSSMFPNLGETIHKNYEVTAYSLSRLEDVISKLKGASDIKDAVNLVQPDRQVSPEAEQVRKNLQQSTDAEKDRKRMRQQMQDQKMLEQVNKPELEVESPGEELASEPVEVKSAPTPKPLPAQKPAPIAPAI